MQMFVKALMLTAAAVLLSGCQSFPLTSWMFKRSDRGQAELAYADGSGSLAEGREALEAGRPAAAIVPLRIALLDKTTRAPASNALGVAYAQMGREDLAEQFFKSAIAADPADTRYVANLLRLQHSVLARKARSDAARLAARTEAQPRPQVGFVAEKPVARPETTRTASSIVRQSRGEVFIASAPAQSAPSAVVAHLEPTTSHPGPKARQPDSVIATASAPKAKVVENPFGELVTASSERP